MKQIILLGNEYEIINDKHKCFALDEVQNLITDYFEPYDYVLGDFSYGKLRLKGDGDVLCLHLCPLILKMLLWWNGWHVPVAL